MYNAECFIGDAIRSIRQQTLSDWELIAVNDGSTDRTMQVAEEVAAGDPRIRIISQKNSGVSAARNAGLYAANGEYYACMDADDVALPHRLARQVEFMRSRPEVVLVGAWVNIVDPWGNHLYTEELPVDHDSIDRRLLGGDGGVIRQPSAMMRRSAVLAVGGYQDRFAGTEDLDLFLKLAERGQVANLAEPLLNYRQHFGSINRTRYERQLRDRQEIVSEAFRRRTGSVPASLGLSEYHLIPPGEQYRSWAWMLLRNGNVKAARRHAMAALRHAPLAIESWRAAACALRGR